MHCDVKKIPRRLPPSTSLHLTLTPAACADPAPAFQTTSTNAAIARLCRYSLNNRASRLSPPSPYDFSLLRPASSAITSRTAPLAAYYPAPIPRKFSKNSGVFIPKSRRLAHFLFAKNFPRAGPTTQLSEFQQNKKTKNFSFFCLTKKQKYTVLVVIMKNTAIQSQRTLAQKRGRLEKIFAKAYCCSARMRKAADCKILL